MRSTSTVFTLAFLVACGSGTDDGDDDGTTNPTACGVAGSASGTECTGLSDCGLGSSNFISPVFCEHCPPRSDTHVCESGTCRATVLGDVDVVFIAPPEARGAKSFTIAVLNPIMADGGTLTCTALLSTCGFVGNEKLNAGNSRASSFPGGSADPANVYTSRISGDVGDNRLVFVQAVTETQGKGSVLARGCVDQVEVDMTTVASVSLDLIKI